MNKFIQRFSDSKDRVVLQNIFISFIIKGGALVISFLSLPAYIRYFENREVLGVWYTMLSLLTWILSFDFGIGNGLRNKLVGAIVRKDNDEIQTYVSSSYIVLAIVVIIGIALGVAVAPLMDWNAFFNISPSIVTHQTLVNVIIVSFITVMLQFFFRLITFILYALQKSALNNFIALITSASQLLYVLFAPSSTIKANLEMLSFVNLLCVNLPLIFATIYVFRNELKGAAPTFRKFDRKAGMSIMVLGGMFFWNQIMYMIITGSNSLFISYFISPEKVIDYQVYYRLFSVAGMLFTLALTPMWSAITKAFEENDKQWINKYFKILNRLVVVLILLEFLLIPFLQIIFDIWLQNDTILVNYTSAIVFAIFGSVFIYQTVLSTFACGLGKMKLQLVFYTVGVIAKTVFIIILIPYYPHWIIVVFSDIIVLLPYCFFEYLSLSRRLGIGKRGEQ